MYFGTGSRNFHNFSNQAICFGLLVNEGLVLLDGDCRPVRCSCLSRVGAVCVASGRRQRWPKSCFDWKVFSLTVNVFTCVNLVLTGLYLAKYLLNSAKLTPDSPRSENLHLNPTPRSRYLRHRLSSSWSPPLARKQIKILWPPIPLEYHFGLCCCLPASED
jgi:hypothetical protein